METRLYVRFGQFVIHSRIDAMQGGGEGFEFDAFGGMGDFEGVAVVPFGGIIAADGVCMSEDFEGAGGIRDGEEGDGGDDLPDDGLDLALHLRQRLLPLPSAPSAFRFFCRRRRRRLLRGTVRARSSRGIWLFSLHMHVELPSLDGLARIFPKDDEHESGDFSVEQPEANLVDDFAEIIGDRLVLDEHHLEAEFLDDFEVGLVVDSALVEDGIDGVVEVVRHHGRRARQIDPLLLLRLASRPRRRRRPTPTRSCPYRRRRPRCPSARHGVVLNLFLR